MPRLRKTVFVALPLEQMRENLEDNEANHNAHDMVFFHDLPEDYYMDYDIKLRPFAHINALHDLSMGMALPDAAGHLLSGMVT